MLECWACLLYLLPLVGALVFLAFAVIQRLITSPLPVVVRHNQEKTFLDPNDIKTLEFPSLEEEPSIDLSVIVPAYNEVKRLPVMLEECIGFLEEKASKDNFSYEIIVVSDGSSDDTVALALKYSKKWTANKIRVLELIENRGKGGAVRLGMFSARGRHLLFADADGATKFADYDKLESSMKSISSSWKDDAIVIGSRAHLEQEAIATRSLFRTILMHGFHFLVRVFAVKSVRDTQCGFKLLSRSAAKKLFNIMHVERWAFDVELLFLAEKLKMPISEIAVRWQEIEGSKVTPFWSWLEMGFDLFLIWLRYTSGAWIIEDKPKVL